MMKPLYQFKRAEFRHQFGRFKAEDWRAWLRRMLCRHRKWVVPKAAVRRQNDGKLFRITCAKCGRERLLAGREIRYSLEPIDIKE